MSFLKEIQDKNIRFISFLMKLIIFINLCWKNQRQTTKIELVLCVFCFPFLSVV